MSKRNFNKMDDDQIRGSSRVLRSSLAKKGGDLDEKFKKRKTTDLDPRSSQVGRLKQTKVKGTKRLAEKHVSTDVQKGKQGTKTTVWSIKDKHEYKIQLPLSVDTSISWITGCHLMDSGEIIMTDFYNKSLKKLDRTSAAVTVCDLPSIPIGMCYIGNNTVAVSLGQKLQFANISGDMNLMQSVDTDHYCKGLTYHDSKILTVNDNSVFIHNYNGKQERCLFTYDSNAYFQGIAVSDDGQRIYITSWNIGLVTIDNKGNHLFTLSDPELNDPFRLSLDNHGNVLICYPHSNIVMQVSPDGKNEMGRIIKATDSIEWPNSLYFDRNTSSIIVGCGGSAYLYVFDLK